MKGLLKSTQNRSFESAAVYLFQNSAEEEILSRWQPEVSAFQEDGKNVSLIAAALDARFRKLKFLSPEDALKLQVRVQSDALDLKREGSLRKSPTKEEVCVGHFVGHKFWGGRWQRRHGPGWGWGQWGSEERSTFVFWGKQYPKGHWPP